MNDEIQRYQWHIRHAIGRLQRKFRANPWIFMTEADIQCSLFAELNKNFRKARQTRTKDARGKRVSERRSQIYTVPLHAELSSNYRRSTEYVDLSVFLPHQVEFWVKASKINGERSPLWDWEWKPKEAIGIEIKWNWEILKTHAFSRKTGRNRVTEKWKNFRRGLIRDMQKLRRYKRGWLIFVDSNALFRNKEEWRSFMDELIRDSNYGRAKKTLNAYYLRPGRGRKPFPFTPYYKAF